MRGCTVPVINSLFREDSMKNVLGVTTEQVIIVNITKL